MKGCGKNIDGWNRCGIMEQGGSLMYCDDCKGIRESGFYWVRWGVVGWIVAEYFKQSDYPEDPSFWQVTGDEEYYTDDEFNEIDEKRINR